MVSVNERPGLSLRADIIDLLRLALPMIVSRAGLAAMSIADAVMVSRYDPGQFAVLSLADGTLGRIVDIFAAFILGGLVLVPRAFGAGDLAECARIWRRSLPPALGLGLLGALLGVCGTAIFAAVGQSAALSSGAGAVSAILGIGYVAALLALGAAVFLEGLKRPTVVAASVVGANVLNVGLNWLLISGNAGLPALGARGSAISTTIVRFALAAVLAGYAWKVTSARREPEAEAQRAPQLQTQLGLSSAVVAGIMLLLTASLLVFAGWLGPLALAVLSATWNLNAPVMLVALGIADATGIRVAARDGQAAGGAAGGANLSLRSIVGLSLAVMSALALVFAAGWAAFPRPLAGVFTRDPAMLRGLTAVIPLAGGLLLLDAVCFIVVSALRALRDVVWPTGIEIATMAGLVPLAAWLAFGAGQGVRGLIIAAIASAVCRVALLVWRFVWMTRPPARAVLPLAGEPT